MEIVDSDIFSEFERLWIGKLEKKYEFENLTDEVLQSKIESVKKNCFVLELQNEVIENYLKRHSPGALRELENYLISLSEKKSLNHSFRKTIHDENDSSYSERVENLQEDNNSKEKNRQTLGHLINIVNQEIAELCLKSKIQRRKHEIEIELLASDCESFKAQSDVLSDAINLFNVQFPSQMKVTPKDCDAKLMEFIKFMENANKEMKIKIRRSSLLLHKLRSQYSIIRKNMLSTEGPVIPADVKLLEIHIEKLNNELSKDRQVFLDLKLLYDNYFMKLNNEKRNQLIVKIKGGDLKKKIKTIEKRLSSIEKYCNILSDEANILERKRIKLKELYSTSTKRSIFDKETDLTKNTIS